MILGYFDESGTDGQLGHTVISGFLGHLEAWTQFQADWKAALIAEGVQEFHYSECVNRKKRYSDWDYESKIKPHLAKMADIVVSHGLTGFSVGHSGDFNSVIAKHPGWTKRFPSSYSLLFEMLVHLIQETVLDDERVTLILAKQHEFSARVKEVFRHYKYANEWPEISHLGWASPRDVLPLQAADMLAYETRRYKWKEDDAYWRNQPLLSRLLPMTSEANPCIHGIGFDDAGLNHFLNQEKGHYLKTPPSLGK